MCLVRTRHYHRFQLSPAFYRRIYGVLVIPPWHSQGVNTTGTGDRTLYPWDHGANNHKKRNVRHPNSMAYRRAVKAFFVWATGRRRQPKSMIYQSFRYIKFCDTKLLDALLFWIPRLSLRHSFRSFELPEFPSCSGWFMRIMLYAEQWRAKQLCLYTRFRSSFQQPLWYAPNLTKMVLFFGSQHPKAV